MGDLVRLVDLDPLMYHLVDKDLSLMVLEMDLLDLDHSNLELK